MWKASRTTFEYWSFLMAEYANKLQYTNLPYKMYDTFQPKKKKHWLSSHSYVFSHHLLFFRHFRYSLTNCLFAATYDKVLEKCHCVPFFHTMAYEDYPRICAGPELLCMNTILRDIGSHTRVRTEDEAGNVKWKPCLFACR